MNRTIVALLLALTCCAGFAGALAEHHLTSTSLEDVYAQQRAETGIRIGLVRVEEVARRTKLFKKRKIDWEAAQAEVRKQDDEYTQAIETKRRDINRGINTGATQDQLTTLRVELQALEETHKAAREEQHKYLEDLLAQYQKEVLQEVVNKIETYAKTHDFDMVVQDYALDATDADFFSGSAYTQTLLSKPVICAPGMARNKNAYVVDITDMD